MDTSPTTAGFVTFCRDVAGITTAAMPDGSGGFDMALKVSQAMIPSTINATDPMMYTLAVYSWGVSWLIQYQQDQSGQTFFKDARKAYKVASFAAGVVSAASDESTSETLAVGAGLQNLSLTDLQRVKDPFGRQALEIMQSMGTFWGHA